MGRLDEIKARIEAFDGLRPEDYELPPEVDPFVEPRALHGYWANIEDDLRWCVEELARFRRCDGFEVFLAPDGENGLRECRKLHWHKEGE